MTTHTADQYATPVVGRDRWAAATKDGGLAPHGGYDFQPLPYPGWGDVSDDAYPRQ
jgi:hypothetical protein